MFFGIIECFVKISARLAEFSSPKSIFRNSNVALFRKRQESYSDGNPGHIVIPMNTNYRSGPGLLSDINHLFSHYMRLDHGAIRYRDQSEQLMYDREVNLYAHPYDHFGVYRIVKPNEERVALFCHQGFSMTWFPYLLGIPPHLFWSSFDINHTGVSVFEFADNPDGLTSPKCLALSDNSHLLREGLPYRFQNRIDL